MSMNKLLPQRGLPRLAMRGASAVSKPFSMAKGGEDRGAVHRPLQIFQLHQQLLCQCHLNRIVFLVQNI